MRSLLAYPTHANCIEVEEQLLASGVEACTYPGRLTSDSEHAKQNCWNESADDAEAIGLSAVAAVCPSCPHRAFCFEHGYMGQLEAASQATVALCTHKRLEYAGFASLASERKYISIHENPVNVLRPRTEASSGDLFQMQVVIHRLLSDPYHLNWFGTVNPRTSRSSGDDELRQWKDRQYQYCLFLADHLDAIVERVASVERTTEIRFKEKRTIAPGVEGTLFRAANRCGAKFAGAPWRFLLATAEGKVVSAAVVVTSRHSQSRSGDSEKTAVGFVDNRPPTDSTVWFNDATSDADTLSTILKTPVQDSTPGGRLPLQRKAVQIPCDITRGTSPAVTQGLLCGVLVDRPVAHRVGIICHRPHQRVLNQLGPFFSGRIVKSAYFGSGDERSSNTWQAECDLIVVAGTPRLSPSEVAAYLIQTGEIGAACQDGEWGPLRWDARTESGEIVTIDGSGYRHRAWQRAYHDLVRASLVQAIGRGRGILADGCEVVVISNQECGLPISDASTPKMKISEIAVLNGLTELSAHSPNNIIGKRAVTTAKLATAVSLKETAIRAALRELERRGLVTKVGERKGWRLVVSASSAQSNASESGKVAQPDESSMSVSRSGRPGGHRTPLTVGSEGEGFD